MSLCHICLENKSVTIDRGTPVCQRCYGKRYSKKSRINAVEKKPTLKDLKRKWERKG
jgi:hypothetical protein